MAVLQVLILLKWVNVYTENIAIEENASKMNICISHRECIKLQKGSLRNKMSFSKLHCKGDFFVSKISTNHKSCEN